MGEKFTVFLKSLLAEKKYIKFALCVLGVLAGTCFSLLLLFETAKAIVNFIKNYHVEIITMVIFIFAGFGAIAKYFNKTPSAPGVAYNQEAAKKEKEGAGVTYEQVIHPNLLNILRELAKYHPIYEPTRSSILPPNPLEGIIDKGSHMLFEVRAKLQNGKSLELAELDRLIENLQEIIMQKLRSHELVNLDNEWFTDDRGISHPKLMIDSVTPSQDSLLIYVATCSTNYLNYLAANPRRTMQKRSLFDDIL